MICKSLYDTNPSGHSFANHWCIVGNSLHMVASDSAKARRVGLAASQKHQTHLEKLLMVSRSTYRIGMIAHRTDSLANLITKCSPCMNKTLTTSSLVYMVKHPYSFQRKIWKILCRSHPRVAKLYYPFLVSPSNFSKTFSFHRIYCCPRFGYQYTLLFSHTHNLILDTRTHQ